MSANWVRMAFIGLLVAGFSVVACDDNPVDEGREDAVGIMVNPSLAVVNAGDTTAIQANAMSRYGDPTLDAVTFTACDNLITIAEDPSRVFAEPPERSLVIGQTLGRSCVEASAAGFRDTAVVDVVAAAVVVTAAPDTLRAGQAGEVVVQTVAKDGSPVGPFARTDASYQSDNAAVAAVTDDMGSLSTSESGQAAITASWSGGGVTRSVDHTLVVVANVPAAAAFAGASFGAVALAQEAELEVVVEDVLGNQNTFDTEILGVTVLSSDPGVASATGALVPGNSVNVIVTVTGEAAGFSDITGTVTTSEGDLAFGPARVTVLNPVINTLTPNSGGVGTQVAISGSGFVSEGFDTEVTVGGEPADNFVSSLTNTAIVVNVPAAGGGDNDVIVTVGGVASNVGTFTQTTSNVDAGEPNDGLADATPITIPFEGYFTEDEDDIDDLYVMTFAAETTITVDLQWNTDADLDILFLDSGGSFVPCFDGATGAQPEQAACTFAPGTYYLWINNFSHSALTTYIVTAAP